MEVLFMVLSIAVTSLLVIALFFILSCVKRIGQNERLITFDSGRPSGVSGPGLVLALPLGPSRKLINISQRHARLPEVKLPETACASQVVGRFEYYVFDPLRAASHADISQSTEEAVRSALFSVLQEATIKQCLIEPLWLEKQALDAINQRTKSLGVKVSALTFSDFPQVRRLLGLVAALPTLLLGDIACLPVSAARRY